MKLYLGIGVCKLVQNLTLNTNDMVIDEAVKNKKVIMSMFENQMNGYKNTELTQKHNNIFFSLELFYCPLLGVSSMFNCPFFSVTVCLCCFIVQKGFKVCMGVN